MPLVIMSRTIDVFFFVKKELSCQSSWQINNAISSEQNVLEKSTQERMSRPKDGEVASVYVSDVLGEVH